MFSVKMGSWNSKPAARSFSGMSCWLSNTKQARSPKPNFNANSGTAKKAGRLTAFARIRLNSSFLTGFGATKL